MANMRISLWRENGNDHLQPNRGDPVLAIDYYKRAYLIAGDSRLKSKVLDLMKTAGLEERAANSVEHIATSF